VSSSQNHLVLNKQPLQTDQKHSPGSKKQQVLFGLMAKPLMAEHSRIKSVALKSSIRQSTESFTKKVKVKSSILTA
jgi:hypothetical protein